MVLKELSNKFYSIYNTKNYPNILRKKTRAYAIYEIKIDNIKYGIPVKTNIKHSSSFIFKDSGRKKTGEKPGLDFKSSIIIVDDSFLDDDGHIDEKEYKYLVKNENEIIKKYIKYIREYKKFLLNPIAKCWESWKFSHTSLEYFWDEMGIIIVDKEKKKLEILFSYNIYLIIKNLCKDLNLEMGNFYVRKISESSVSISYLGYYVIKNLTLTDIDDYIKIFTQYDKNGEIKYDVQLGIEYTKLISIIEQIINVINIPL